MEFTPQCSVLYDLSNEGFDWSAVFLSVAIVVSVLITWGAIAAFTRGSRRAWMNRLLAVSSLATFALGVGIATISYGRYEYVRSTYIDGKALDASGIIKSISVGADGYLSRLSVDGKTFAFNRWRPQKDWLREGQFLVVKYVPSLVGSQPIVVWLEFASARLKG
jgi:hypothetical protein